GPVHQALAFGQPDAAPGMARARRHGRGGRGTDLSQSPPLPEEENQGMKYFHLNEFECGCGCGRAEMNPTFLAALDRLRERYGKPLVVTSGYRCPSYNSKVSSTGPTGPHTTGKAADLRVDRGDAYRLLKLALDAGFTGIGVQQK